MSIGDIKMASSRQEAAHGPHAGMRLVESVRYLARNPVWLLGLGLFIFFSVTTSHFLTAYNLSNVLFQCALVGLLATGLTPVIISGNIDLSVGAVVGLSSCLVIGMQEQIGLAGAIAVALGSGLCLGLLNGLAVERLGVSSFIITLAGMIGTRGLAFLYAGDTSLSAIDEQLYDLTMLHVGPVTLIPFIFLTAVLCFQWMLRRTVHGRNTYAIGGSRSASTNAGIPVSRHVVINFIICGLMAAICGVAMAANLGAATPSYGKDYELWAVIAVVLGGTRLRGGKGDLIGTFAAVLALAILRNGLNMLHVAPFYIPGIMGLALIAALVLDRQLNRASKTAE
ncbi:MULTISPECIES: ABC transporter permease [Mesorhizobium]|uniref:ABC transporter permease n=1 Tax=Mesorhizobium TaxID=68287 RepID=UPI001AEDCEE1|nr:MULTISPECIES: ABC transporter permease [Mesorhizobium]